MVTEEERKRRLQSRHEYYLQYRDRIRAEHKRAYEKRKHKPEYKAYAKQYWQTHREQNKAKNSRDYYKHREERIEKQRKARLGQRLGRSGLLVNREPLGTSFSQTKHLIGSLGLSMDTWNFIKSKNFWPIKCSECGRTYSPSGSKEGRCWTCQHESRTEYMRKYMEDYRNKSGTEA